MELFWKAAGAVLIVIILRKAIPREELSVLLSLLACISLAILLTSFLEPILDFLKELQKVCAFEGDMLLILLKALGIGIITQITEAICKDSGNAALGQTFQFLGTAVILWLSIPIFNVILKMIETMLGAI